MNKVKVVIRAPTTVSANLGNIKHSSGSGMTGYPSVYNGNVGDVLMKTSASVAEWVTPANSAEQDNTRPITSAAVYTEIGNINALLATI